MKSPGTGHLPSTEFHPQMHPLSDYKLLSCFLQARNIRTICTIYLLKSKLYAVLTIPVQIISGIKSNSSITAQAAKCQIIC